MKTQEEIRAACADALRSLRVEKGYTKAQMCIAANVDSRTWNKYESGESAPDVAQFLDIFASLGEDAMLKVLQIVYPDTYQGLTPSSDINLLREAAAHYFLHTASEKTVREWDYIVLGQHGSNIEPQMQEFCMLEHLPMEYRYAVAEMILTFWNLAERRNELIGMEYVQPDIETFLAGLQKGRDAAMEHRNSYTTAAEATT